MRIQDNIAYGLKTLHLPQAETKKRTSSLLDFVGLKRVRTVLSQVNSAADKDNVRRWQGRWLMSLKCCCLMNQFPPLTRNFASLSGWNLKIIFKHSKSQPSTSPITLAKPLSWQTKSQSWATDASSRSVIEQKSLTNPLCLCGTVFGHKRLQGQGRQSASRTFNG